MYLFNYDKEKTELEVGIVHSKRKDTNSPIKAFQEGRLRVLISVSQLSIGFDAPIADTMILLRPTKIRRLFNQIIRVSRTHKPLSDKLSMYKDRIQYSNDNL